MFRRLVSALLLRRVVSHLSGIETALTRQNDLLHRLADHFAPIAAVPDRESVKVDTGVSFLDSTDAGLALDYIERTLRDTGHTPDEEEILIYLADEKTHDLHQRLVAREAELERLSESRR